MRIIKYSKKDIESANTKEKIEELKARIQMIKFKNKIFKTEVNKVRLNVI